MKPMDLLKALGHVKDSYVIGAEEFRQGKQQVSTKHLLSRKALLIAAVIALTLLLVGCAVVYVLRLQDMKIGEKIITEQEHYGPNWEVIEETQITYDVLSVQSFSDSPNQRATKEWRAYTDTFTLEYFFSLPEEVGRAVPEGYSNYGCRTPEMMEKLDEIAEKYSLKLIGESLYTNQSYVDVLLDELDLPQLLRPQTYAEVRLQSAGIYQNGGFQLGVNIVLDESFDWPYYVMADLHYSAKGYFDPYTIRLRDLDTVQEWEYTLEDGKTALLALDQETALILVEGKEGFFAMDFDSQMGIDRVTTEMMERIADLFDFSMIPHRLTEEEWEGAKAAFHAAEEKDLQQYNAWIEANRADEQKEGYDPWVRQTLENSREIKSLGYAFYDIDGNGTQELLIGRDGYCTAIYWERDGKTEQFANAAANLYVCEDGKVAFVLMPGEEEFNFVQLENGTSTGLGSVQYTPGNPEGEYRSSDPERWREYVYISKEAYEQTLSSYKRIPISFVPLTEYPLDEPVGVNRQKDVYDAGYSSYEEMIRIRLTDRKERWSRWAYDMLDLDGDGQEEMIWREDDRYYIYTVMDGKVCCYSMINDGTITVCDDSIVQAVIHYGPENFTTRFYRLNRGHIELVDYLRYDVDAAPENPWFRSLDLTGQDMTLEPISAMEAKSIIASYSPLKINMKPIADYPFA